MKQDNDYPATSQWSADEIPDPYQVITEFFTYDTIPSHRKIVEGALKAACSKRLYRRSDPGDLLFDFKMLESIMTAAHAINKEKKKGPLIMGVDNVLNTNLYCGRHTYLSEWHYFPRFLSVEEYRNPYLAFKRFFKYQSLEKWKQDLQDILGYALSKDSLFDAGIEINIITIFLLLIKLLEAAHLIDVRKVLYAGAVIEKAIG